MGALNCIIINEISDGSVHTFRLDQSDRETTVYGIDTPDAQDISVYSERGRIRFTQEIVGSRTAVRFSNRAGYYALTYTKPNFIKNDGGIYSYSETWDVVGRSLIVFALPPYSVLVSANQEWQTSKTKENNLLLDLIFNGALKTEFQFQINSMEFTKSDFQLTNGANLPIGFFYEPGFLKNVVAKSEELLDWLQRFQALYQLVIPFIEKVRNQNAG